MRNFGINMFLWQRADQNLSLAVPQNWNLQPYSLSNTQVGFPDDSPIPLGSRSPTQAQEIKNGFFSSS